MLSLRDRSRNVLPYPGCDVRPFNPLIITSPRVLHVRERAGKDSWLTQFFRAAVTESTGGRAAGEAMLARLSELMFAEVVRHFESLPSERIGSGLQSDLQEAGLPPASWRKQQATAANR